jgi:hypothetical protein
MTNAYAERPAGIRRRILIVTTALIVLSAALATAVPALAKSPTGDFAVFSQCPRFTKEVNLCVYIQSTSGEAILGKQAVPVTKTITLQGGIIRNEETEAETFVEALNKESLSKTPEKVPGGLLGLVKCNEISNFFERVACEVVFENGATGVNATTELAKPASDIGVNKDNLVAEQGVALSLPIKIQFENPLLGNECYVGSDAHPITWNLTTGTTEPPAPNKPISGKAGEFEFKDEFTFIQVTGNTVVDNAWAAPEATGCGGLFSFLIDPLLDSKLGLPSAAGHNTTILNGTLKLASSEAVIASEK